MKFSQTLVALAGFATAAIAAPATTYPETATFVIEDFTLRKNGTTIQTVFFNVVATDGSTPEFECDAYDYGLDAVTNSFQSGEIYACAEFSWYSFTFTPATETSSGELTFWELFSQATGASLAGQASIPEPICRAGGAGPEDYICTVPTNVTITLTRD